MFYESRKKEPFGKTYSILFSLPIGLLFLGLAACGERRGEEGAGMPLVVSIAPHAYLVERIGGVHVRVNCLVHPGESPATYQPSDQQVSEVMRSKAYFRTGVPFEKGKWLKAIQSSGKEILIQDLREGIRLREMGKHDHESHEGEEEDSIHGHEHEGSDPHIWLSPELLKVQAQTVARIISELDPEHSKEYQANLKVFLADMDLLDGELKKLLAPFRARSIYLYHPAWGYFCDAYGLKQVAIEFEGKEPSDEELTRFKAKIREEGVKVIFVQPQISGKSAEAAAEGIGGVVRVLDPLSRDVIQNLRAAGQAMAESFQ